MKPGPGLRRRLLVAAALSIVLALAVAGAALLALFRSHVEAELADRMREQLDGLVAGLARDAGGALHLDPPPADPAFERPQGGLYWVVQTPAGELLRSRSWWDHAHPDGLARALSAIADTPPGALPGPSSTAPPGAPSVRAAPADPVRLTAGGPAGQTLALWARRVHLGRDEQPLAVAVGADTRRIAGMTRRFGTTMALGLAVLAAVLWGAAWLQVRAGLAPLLPLQDALHRIRGGRATRVDGRHPGELQPLVDALNAVLADNDALVQAARRQAADLAHGLKTPLAVIGNALARWPGDDGALVRAELARIDRQVHWQLALAGALRPGSRHEAATALEPIVAPLLRALARLHAGRGLALDARLPAGPVAVRMPAPSLQECLGNLLDNACQWARSRVVLEAAVDDGRVTVAIEDDGPGIPAERRAEALQRGRRLDERRPGSGLGLAIASELVRRYGGDLTLADAALGGLRVRIVLPGGSAPSTGP